MATSVLNSLILKASRMVQEMRTSAAATDDTDRRWKSENWTDYVNRALRDYLQEKLQELGLKEFMKMYPEYVKPSGVLTLVSGSVAKPTDALIVVDLVKSDLSVYFERLDPTEVESVRTGANPLYVPSATAPVFWEEDGKIKTLGQISGNVIAKYIATPIDLVVITAAAGNGKRNTFSGQYTHATRLLQGTMNVPFAAGDENRKIMFYDNSAGKVYYGRIASVKDSDEVYVDEVVPGAGGLPAADIAAGNVTMIMMEQVSDPDIALKNFWHGELLNRIIQYAMADSLG
jgi:hypothetical protein